MFNTFIYESIQYKNTGDETVCTGWGMNTVGKIMGIKAKPLPRTLTEVVNLHNHIYI